MPIQFIIIIIIIGLLIIASVLETFCLTIHRYEITPKRSADKIIGKSILLLSDQHGVSFGPGNKRLFQKIDQLHPDAIIIAGDLINGHKSNEIYYTFDFLSTLYNKHYEVYYALGNHENKLKLPKYNWFLPYTEMASDMSTLLINKGIHNDALGAYIYGLNIPLEFNKGPIEQQAPQIDVDHIFDGIGDDYRILIAHDPSFIDRYLRSGADLILSGHIHGGIIRIPFLGGLLSPRRRFFPEPDKGRYTYCNKDLIVSGGLGWHGLPVRLFNRPEMVLITFTSEGK